MRCTVGLDTYLYAQFDLGVVSVRVLGLGSRSKRPLGLRIQNKLVERPLSCACGENTARNIQALLNVYCILLSVPTVDTKTTQTDENPTDRHKTGPSRSLVRGRVRSRQIEGTLSH